MSVTFDQVAEGMELPALSIHCTASLITATAIATRDYQPVHHDKNAANAQGMPQVFMNILTTGGLVSRFVTDWAGPEARVKAIKTRLGVPTFAEDTMVFSGKVTRKAEENGEHLVDVQVIGKNGLGDHATSTVTLALPKGAK